jgi:hypothetical protein
MLPQSHARDSADAAAEAHNHSVERVSLKRKLFGVPVAKLDFWIGAPCEFDLGF